MEIGGSLISPDQSPYFIAEAGVNHNGDVEIALELIEIAADAGADAVKFQSYNTERLVTTGAAKADYQADTTAEGSQYDMLKEYELDRQAHERLIHACQQCGITFLSTPFDSQSADMLADLGVPAIKLGSGELDNHPLLEHVAGLGTPMIVSTGMGTMEEVEAARNAIRSVDSTLDFALLHCTSAYPCPVDEVNLRAMETLANVYPEPVGFSDHTMNPQMPGYAVAAGAQIIEKHFTLDSALPGPDHETSLEPGELAQAVDAAQTAWQARGSPIKQPTDAEASARYVARKSLRAARHLERGTTLTADDIQSKRPADGLSPRYFQTIVGTTLQSNLSEDEPFTEEVVEIDLD